MLQGPRPLRVRARGRDRAHWRDPKRARWGEARRGGCTHGVGWRESGLGALGWLEVASQRAGGQGHAAPANECVSPPACPSRPSTRPPPPGQRRTPLLRPTSGPACLRGAEAGSEPRAPPTRRQRRGRPATRPPSDEAGQRRGRPGPSSSRPGPAAPLACCPGRGRTGPDRPPCTRKQRNCWDPGVLRNPWHSSQGDWWECLRAPLASPARPLAPPACRSSSLFHSPSNERTHSAAKCRQKRRGRRRAPRRARRHARRRWSLEAVSTTTRGRRPAPRRSRHARRHDE